jgi:predicted ATPase
LNKLCGNNSYIKFIDIYQKYNFISLGYEYEDLKKLYPNEFDNILEVLSDVVFLEKYYPNSQKLVRLKQHEAFEVSLCRDQSAKKILDEARFILYNKNLNPERFKFAFEYKLNNRKFIFRLNFIKQDLPHRINIVIGKNGVGKTKFLEILCKYFLYNSQKNKKLKDFDIKIDNEPTFISNIIAISFNIYENFELDNKKNVENFDVKNYKYLGYRNEEGKIEPQILEKKAFNSFKNIFKKDFNNFSKEIFLYEKSFLSRIIKILTNAFQCKYIGLLKENAYVYLGENFFNKNNFNKNKMYNINFEDYEEKLYFFNRNKKLINLSSGQRTFANMVINIVGSIKKNSLILIDEPENTLHPNYEIDFMNILYDILEEFDSFAIIATHSAIITREVPKQYVNIIKINSEDEIVVVNPPIQTFGANIMDINNLVFDDIFKENKPFEKWLKKQYMHYPNFDKFFEKYSKTLSYDFMLEAKRLWSIWNDKN